MNIAPIDVVEGVSSLNISCLFSFLSFHFCHWQKLKAISHEGTQDEEWDHASRLAVIVVIDCIRNPYAQYGRLTYQLTIYNLLSPYISGYGYDFPSHGTKSNLSQLMPTAFQKLSTNYPYSDNLLNKLYYAAGLLLNMEGMNWQPVDSYLPCPCDDFSQQTAKLPVRLIEFTREW